MKAIFEFIVFNGHVPTLWSDLEQKRSQNEMNVHVSLSLSLSLFSLRVSLSSVDPIDSLSSLMVHQLVFPFSGTVRNAVSIEFII